MTRTVLDKILARLDLMTVSRHEYELRVANEKSSREISKVKKDYQYLLDTSRKETVKAQEVLKPILDKFTRVSFVERGQQYKRYYMQTEISEQLLRYLVPGDHQAIEMICDQMARRLAHEMIRMNIVREG